MKRNRILAIGIALLLAVQLLTPLACAAGTTLKLTAPDKLPDVGQTFTVTAELTGNTGLAAVQLSLGYDDSVVECTGIENGALIAGMLAASNPYATRDGVGAILAAATTTAVKTDGSLAVFTFRVKAAGDAKLTLADALLSDIDGKALPLSYSLPALIAQGSGSDSGSGSGSDAEKPGTDNKKSEDDKKSEDEEKPTPPSDDENKPSQPTPPTDDNKKPDITIKDDNSDSVESDVLGSEIDNDKTEQKKESIKQNNRVQTGDQYEPLLYGVMLAVSLAVPFILKKRKGINNEKESNN